jgi:hypothetical protein
MQYLWKIPRYLLGGGQNLGEARTAGLGLVTAFQKGEYDADFLDVLFYVISFLEIKSGVMYIPTHTSKRYILSIILMNMDY